jgi:hypothetical protein
VLAVFGVAFKWTFLTAGSFELLFLGAPLLIASGLVYGRLIGRLAFVLAFTKPLLARRKKRKPEGDEDAGAARTDETEEAERPRVRQPRELPPMPTPRDDEPITGYDLTDDEEPPAKKPRKRVRAEAVEPEPEVTRPRQQANPQVDRSRQWTDEDEDATPYGVNAPEVEPEKVAPAEVVKPSAVETRLLSRDDAPKPPKEAWSAQLLAFLVQPETIPVIGLLSALCILAGLMVRIARMFNPA